MVGGKIGPGEAAWQAALRELKEETGLSPSRLFALPFVSRFYEPEHDRLNDIPVFLALLNAPGAPCSVDIALDGEHDHHLWLAAPDAKRRLAWPGQRAGIDASEELLRDERLHRYLEVELPQSTTRPRDVARIDVDDGRTTVESSIADTQSGSDLRGVALQEVGVCDVTHPIAVRDGTATTQATVAACSLAVSLAADRRGTHMSRFLQALNEWHEPLSLASALTFARLVRERLEAEQSTVTFTFPWFAAKEAPRSGAVSLMDYKVTLSASSGSTEFTELSVRVPVKSLCPCSKAISSYGAHNQRSHISVTVTPRPELLDSFTIGALIETLEEQGSAQVYGVLKRTDEKWVTEVAYDNPKFVEDVTRDVVLALRSDARLERFVVRVENFESIHNHTAFARYDG